MKRAGTCRYFNGIQHARCDKDLVYRDVVGGPYFGWANRLPCIASGPVNANARAVCSSFEEPTAADLKADRAAKARAMAMFRQVIPIIESIKREHRGATWTGEVTCPVCRGRLLVAHAGLNGHVSGRCLSTNCLEWQE